MASRLRYGAGEAQGAGGQRSPPGPDGAGHLFADGSPTAPPGGLPQKARDLAALRDAVVDAANVSGTLWFSYLFVLLYLIIAAGSVTHGDLFLERPVRLPFLNVDLPLRGFAWLGPLLFLIAHAYILLQFVLFASKIGVFHMELDRQVADRTIRTDLRRQLPNNVFVQFLAGPREVRTGIVGAMLRAIAWITLIAGPVALLVFFQLQFLPYHDWAITWWQRVAVLVDLGLLWLLWPSIATGQPIAAAWAKTLSNLRGGITTFTGPRVWRFVQLGTSTASLAAIALVFLVATYPGEWIDGASRAPGIGWLHQRLVAGKVDFVSRRLDSLWSNVLVLPGFDAIDHNRFKSDTDIFAARETVNLQGRNLRGAILMSASVPKGDFAGAIMDEADLTFADLRGANFGCGVSPTKLVGDAPPEKCTKLRGAVFDGAQLQAANFRQAQLVGATFFGTDLRAASLDHAQMAASIIGGARLTAAVLDGADIRVARISSSDLRAASFDHAHLDGAIFRNDQLQGANLRFATLEGTDFVDSFFWRASTTQPFASARVARPNTELIHLSPRPDGCQDAKPMVGGYGCRWSMPTFDALGMSILSDVPAGSQREAAIQSIRRLDPDPLLTVPGASSTTWEDARNRSVPADWLGKRTSVWETIGCAEGAIAILKFADWWAGINFDAGAEPSSLAAQPWIRQVANRFLGNDCPGSRGLDDATIARLVKVRDFLPTGD